MPLVFYIICIKDHTIFVQFFPFVRLFSAQQDKRRPFSCFFTAYSFPNHCLAYLFFLC